MMSGRPIKENADYFSHDADASNDEKLIYLESIFGFKGYAFYFKMLEILTRANNFEIEFNGLKKPIYAKKIGISIEEFDSVLSECCRKEIQAFIVENNVLFSPGLKKRMQPLKDKRKNMRQKYKNKTDTEYENDFSESEMTQRKEEKRKKEKNKKEEIKENCESPEEVRRIIDEELSALANN